MKQTHTEKVEQSTFPISKKPINNLVVVSDLHAGCQFGLCPADGIILDGGGQYTPSPSQKVVAAWWDVFWGEWVPQVTKGEPYVVAINGDATDGRHHGSTTQVSQNLADQIKIAHEILSPVRAAKMCAAMYVIRGTEAHVGPCAEIEEELASGLDTTPDSVGNHSRNDLWIRIGQKTLCHLLHHIGCTGSSAFESSAVNAELTAAFVEAARWSRENPSYVVRSHRHRCIIVDMDTAGGYAAGIVTPGWQLKTPFTFKVAGARIQQPQFGGVLIRSGDEEQYYRRKVWSIERPATEEPMIEG